MSGVTSITESSGDILIDDDTYKRFFKNMEFGRCLQEYLLSKYSIEVKIYFEEQPKKYRSNTKKSTQQIRIVIIKEIDSDKQQILFNFLTNYFKKIYTKIENDSLNMSYFHWIQKDAESLILLHKLLKKKIDDLFTLVSVTSNGILSINSLPKNPTDEINAEKLEYFLYNDIVQEVVSLPLAHERSIQLETELKTLLAEQRVDDEILIKKIYLAKQKEIIIFGLDKNVHKIKRDILQIIERNILLTYKFNHGMNELLMYYDILPDYDDQIRKLEKNYKHFGVSIRLHLNEFSAPRHLKDEIESSIQQFLSQSTNTNIKTFESQSLFRKIAEQEEKHLKSLVEKYRCYMKTELQHTSTIHSVPKSSIIDNQVSKSVLIQSDLFSSSSEIFKTIFVRNGSIQLRIGDIALQEVEALVIPRMFNGLKEGVIERAGPFDYEKTEIQSDGTMYTETDGGKLNCKRILFSNWTANSLIKNENILKSSIRSLIAKSIESMKSTTSIAFSVPDSCTDETILAREMFLEAKQQLENESYELRIVFVLLPEQKSLYKLFSDFIESTYFDWPMTVVRMTLIGVDSDRINHCEKRLKKYLSRCVSSVKISDSNGIFQFWDQHLINSFYKYSKDRCTLPKLDETQTEIEFIGSTTSIQEVKKKFIILSKLVKEKRKYASVNKRPSSARSEANNSIKLYNIVLSYNRRDIRKCQRLVNRLTEEGFSVGIDEDKRDICSQMTKSDCIILCISENYYENLACIEEAKYAFETETKVFLVTFQNTPSFGWNEDLFQGNLFFQLFGSQYHFDFEYERLLIELLQYTRPGFTSLLQRKTSFVQENNESRLSQALNCQSRNLGQLTFNEERWLHKVENIPRLKLALYSARSSFINHESVPTEMPSYAYKTLDTDVPRPVSFNISHRSFADNEETYGIRIEKSSQIFPADQSCEDFIPRRGDQTYYNFPCWIATVGCRTEEEIEQRQKYENLEEMKHIREKLASYFMKKYQHYTTDQLKVYLKFAQRMEDNTEAFNAFCEKHAIEN